MSKCLVTGYLGYIGSRVYRELSSLGHKVYGIDLKGGENVVSDLWKYDFFEPDFIFHLAAIPRVAYSVKYPKKVLINNIFSTISLLEFARKSGTKRVIYSSSSSVVGNGDGPTSPYGASKLIPEILCKNYSTVYGVDTVSLRYFNVYSADQKAEGPYATAVANWMKYIREGKDPFITGDGEQRRDMLHVNDAVSANVFCMNYDGKFNGQHFDTGTGENISLNEIKDIVLKFHPETKFEYVDPRPGDVLYTKANTQPLAELGWEVCVKIGEGISECFKNLAKENNNE